MSKTLHGCVYHYSMLETLVMEKIRSRNVDLLLQDTESDFGRRYLPRVTSLSPVNRVPH